MIDYWLLYNNNNLTDYSNLEEFVGYGILYFGTSNILNYVIPGICITNQVSFVAYRLQNFVLSGKSSALTSWGPIE